MQQTWPSQVQLHTQPHATSLHQALVDLVALRDQVAWSVPQSPFWTELCVTEGRVCPILEAFLRHYGTSLVAISESAVTTASSLIPLQCSPRPAVHPRE